MKDEVYQKAIEELMDKVYDELNDESDINDLIGMKQKGINLASRLEKYDFSGMVRLVHGNSIAAINTLATGDGDNELLAIRFTSYADPTQMFVNNPRTKIIKSKLVTFDN